MNHQTMVDDLIDRYKMTFDHSGTPEGFFKTSPTIPWIGQNYLQFKILIYASAENLSEGWINANRDLFTSAFNRHSEFMRLEKKIRIQPYDTGGLQLLGLLCLALLGFPLPTQEDIADYVAVGNLSKFSLNRQGNHNVDVKLAHITASEEYLQHDVEVLNPTMIINASGKGFPESILLPSGLKPKIVAVPQYTHTQLGFHHLRKKIKDVTAFKSTLQRILQGYEQGPLASLKQKMSNDDFIRYFCWAHQNIKDIIEM